MTCVRILYFSLPTLNDRLYARTKFAELGVCDEYTESQALELIEEEILTLKLTKTS